MGAIKGNNTINDSIEAKAREGGSVAGHLRLLNLKQLIYFLVGRKKDEKLWQGVEVYRQISLSEIGHRLLVLDINVTQNGARTLMVLSVFA